MQLLLEVGETQQTEIQKPVVDGKEVTQAQFQEMQANTNIRLKKLEEGSYKTLQKLQG